MPSTKEQQARHYAKHKERILAKKEAERRALGAKPQHGLTSKDNPLRPTYRAWQQIKDRCLNPDCEYYKNYGGRGIGIHEDWVNNPEAFCAYLGVRPSPLHSVDRINNNGHYAPGNVRWATYAEQNQNRRPSRTTGKLTSERVLEIKEYLAEKRYSYAHLAGVFSVHWTTIRSIAMGLTWKNLTR